MATNRTCDRCHFAISNNQQSYDLVVQPHRVPQIPPEQGTAPMRLDLCPDCNAMLNLFMNGVAIGPVLT